MTTAVLDGVFAVAQYEKVLRKEKSLGESVVDDGHFLQALRALSHILYIHSSFERETGRTHVSPT